MTEPAKFTGPGFARLIFKARRSLESTGGDLAANVGIPAPTDAERKAIGGLLGRHIPSGVKQTTVKLAELDVALRARSGAGLVDLLEKLGPELRNRPQALEQERRAKADLLAVAQASPLYGSAEWFRDWVERLARDGTFTKLTREPARFAQAVRVLERIDGNLVPLPKLAGLATEHSHALDHPRPLSGLVLAALAIRAGVPKPKGAEERRELWDRFNVIVDDLASRVLVLNLAARGAGLGEWLSGAASFGTPFQVTLHQLVTHALHLDHPIVYVCENPAVLREAAEVLGPRALPLICAEGRPSTAFHRLAWKITDSGGELRYHGDFDWPGVEMAGAVISRHGAMPWRLAADDYLQAVGRESGDLILDGDERPTPWDVELGQVMARVRRPIYEETVADLLLSDLDRDAPSL
ncbi:TIGR02679 family protein [Planotetraspora mira]|uniref:TIGR02679 family protein n=1 Tax=Planotetraspora mira TaxID=58121 RepID=A0A8J3TRK5_9ACTN|nr:TIGR02679 family protein [Planotetraspora mira]GII31838.1 hypothetical protein Pmi06nite_52800 [Planotetraspora mira]